MNRIGLIALCCAALGIFTAAAAGQSASTNQVSASQPAGAKTAGETFKNLQVLGDLKGSPSSELWDTMQVFAGSLSVSCNYCHVAQAGPYDSDANKTKLIARNMIRMTRTINENNFGGRRVVTCNTCHQGSPVPKATPTPWNRTAEQIVAYNEAMKARSDTAAAPAGHSRTESAASLPDVDQVITSYRRAVGSQRLKSVHMSGIAADLTRGSRPRDVVVVFPDKIVVGTTGAQQIVNGDRGWLLTPQARTDLQPGVIAALKDFAKLLQPVKYEQSDVTRKVTGVQTIDSHAYYVVESHPGRVRATAPANSYPDAVERLFFDAQTGLLHKDQVTIETPFGTRVEETSFEDYRDAGGWRLPYSIVTHYMEDENLFKISKIQTNVDIDPRKFQPADPKGRQGGGH